MQLLGKESQQLVVTLRNFSLLLALMLTDRGCLIKKQNNTDKKTVLGASPDKQLHLMKVVHIPTLMRLS